MKSSEEIREAQKKKLNIQITLCLKDLKEVNEGIEGLKEIKCEEIDNDVINILTGFRRDLLLAKDNIVRIERMLRNG